MSSRQYQTANPSSVRLLGGKSRQSSPEPSPSPRGAAKISRQKSPPDVGDKTELSPESSPRSRRQQHWVMDDRIARRGRPDDRPTPPARSNSKIPTLVRHLKIRDKAGSTSARDTGVTESDRRRRRSSGELSCETAAAAAAKDVVAASRIPRITRRGASNWTAAVSDSDDASSSRRGGTDRSRQSSPELSQSLSSCTAAKKSRQKSPTHKLLSEQMQLMSPSGALSTPKTNELPKDDEPPNAAPLHGEEQEQSLADLIVQAFASSPLSSKKSPKSKAAIGELFGSNTARRAKARAERIASHQLDQTVETSPCRFGGDMSPRLSATSKVEERDGCGNSTTSRQSSPSLSPAPKVTKTKRHRPTETMMSTVSDPVEVNQSLPRYTEDPSSASANASGQLLDAVADCHTADESTFASSSRNTPHASKISRSPSTSKKSGSTSVVDRSQKRQSANRSTTKRKSLANTGKSSPRYLSTAAGAAADDRRQNQLPKSTPAEEVGTLDVVDDDPMNESPREDSPSYDKVRGRETELGRKTAGGDVATSKNSDAGRTSTSPTGHNRDEDDDDDDEEEATIADMVDQLRRRLDADSNQLASLRDDAAGQTANGAARSSDAFAALPNAAAAAIISHLDMEVEDIRKETFPVIEPLRPRRRKSRRNATSRGRPVAPERHLTLTADSDTALEEYSGDMASGTTADPRELTWIEDNATVDPLSEFISAVHDNDTRPPRAPERELTWRKDTAATTAECSDDEMCGDASGLVGQTTGAEDLEQFRPRTSPVARKTGSRFSDVNVDSRREQSLRRRSPDDDTATSPDRHRTSNSDTTNKLLLHGPPSSPHTSPPLLSPPQPCRSPPVPWNIEPRGRGASPVLSDSDADSDDDFRPPADLTENDSPRDPSPSDDTVSRRKTEARRETSNGQRAQSAARRMYADWTEIADCYAGLLSRCRSLVGSDATIARRLTELRRRAASLIDVVHGEQLGGMVVDARTRRRLDALRRDWRQWMTRRVESELLLVSRVADALGRFSDNVATHDLRRYDTGATPTTIGITTAVLVICYTGERHKLKTYMKILT